jgi:predicted nucleotidyltransferase
MACDKFYLIEERAEYPRCRYRWMHDKEELKSRYFLCDNGEKMWNEKQRCYQASRDFDEAQKMLREQRTRYIEYLVANEKIKRCAKVKTRRI